MKSTQTHCLRAIAILAVAVLGAQLSADVVETKGGARIPGKVVKIDAGAVVVDTDFAGTVTIKQSEVTSINTEGPVAIRLATGTRLEGIVTSAAGSIRITNADGSVTTTVDKVAASWAAGGRDPQIIALERNWAYEASLDIAGKTGNKSQLGTSAAVRATLSGANDTLMFYSAYDRQVSDGAKSADQFKAGSDYQNNFAGAKSWYIRDEGGFDRIKDIQFYNVVAAGLGFDSIKKPNQTLTFRFGFSFRNENYKNPLTDDINAAGLDLGMSHSLKFNSTSLVNRITIVPSFNDFANYRLSHESFFELPLANPSWKLRFGLSNDYNSKPGAGVKKLDTGYFSRLVLNWK